MKPISRLLPLLVAAALIVPWFGSTGHAAAKKEFNIAWTIYVGWMPWPYAADAGIVKKWANKYGITINITQINDYVESINQYTAGKFDGVTLTNMDALTIPAAGGVDTSAIIMGDFSNGNDGIVLKNGKTLSDIKGRKINIVELLDGPGNDPARFLQAIDLLEQLAKEAPPVLVHCRAGMSRAPSVVAGYLMRERGLAASEAIAMVAAKRPTVLPAELRAMLKNM